MPQYIVLKTSNGPVPADGTVGSADVYIGTHADEATAAAAAATKWRLGAATPLWAVQTATLVAFHTSTGVTLG
jgi:hypothetical protein